MRIFAFQALRYASGVPRAGSLAAPPFDQIDDALRDRLHGVEGHFSHLTRPRAPEGADPHRHAARLHRDWREAGTIAAEAAAALFPYEILLAGGGRRLGLCTLVGLEDPASGLIRPHEETVSRTVEERLGLLRATRLDLEPILMLADDGGRLDGLLAADVAAAAPLVEHADADGHRHRLYRVAEAARIEAYRDALAPAVGLIADGHHRYGVARRYAREASAPPGSAAAAKLAVLTSVASPGVTIEPIHRGLAALGAAVDPELAPADRRAAGAAGGAALAAEVAAAPQPSIGVWRHGAAPEIWRLDPAAAPAGTPPEEAALSVGLLHAAVLPRLGLDRAAATDGTVLYRSDPDRLWRDVERGDLRVGFWLPPIAPELFARATSAGRLLPPKSTRFVPKLASGLVWASHDAPIG